MRGGENQIAKAKRALSRLVGLSPACIEGKPPLSAKELHAKATVLSAFQQRLFNTFGYDRPCAVLSGASDPKKETRWPTSGGVFSLPATL
jgi:hypothetical protein